MNSQFHDLFQIQRYVTYMSHNKTIKDETDQNISVR